MMTNLYDLVAARAAAYPDAVALGGQDGLAWLTLSSRDLLARVDAQAAELAAHGIRAGDRVVTWLPNAWSTPVALFALWKLGAVVVPFDREMNPTAASQIIAATRPRCLLVGYPDRPDWSATIPTVDWPLSRQQSVVVGSQPPDASPHPPTLAAIFFTSGTTGQPKGCMMTHANLLSQVAALRTTIPMGPGCRLASLLPLSHLFELTCGLLYPLAHGAAIHYVPSRRGPDILRVLAERRITHMIAVPQLLTLMGATLEARLAATLPTSLRRGLNALADRLPLAARRPLFWPVHRRLGGHVRLLASGGAALPDETHRLWERLGVRVVQGYGTSECSPVVACGTADGRTPIGSVGRPLAGTTVRLSAEGEVLVRGPQVMAGYWADPTRTAEVLSDGWYATGDLGRFDEGGNLWLLGRAKDLIVLPSGLNVWPSDVEDALREQAGVKDAAVVAVPTPGGGAALHAHLIPTGDERAIAGIIGAANRRLAVHQRLASASWWPEPDFPRTTTLKVRRALLPLPNPSHGSDTNPTAVDVDAVQAAIAGVAQRPSPRPDQTLGELGLDSLSLLDLALAIEEKTGLALADGDLTPDLTVAQVQALVARADGQPAATGPRPVPDEGRQPPRWPYTGLGRLFGWLALPFDLLYAYGVSRTVVLGQEHLAGLPRRVILAGTHHSFADLHVVRRGLARTPARHLAGRLIVAAAAMMMAGAGWLAWLAILAFRLFPLRQYRDRQASLRQLADLAGAGHPVLIFPQGHHADPAAERAGEPAANFKAGAAHLAAALGAVVVPFGLAGTEHIVPPTAEGHRGLVIANIPVAIRRGPVAVAFGPPLARQPDESAGAFTERLQAVCYSLTRRAEAALPAAGPMSLAER